MEVYVIRHTAVAIPKGICYGQSDVPLAASAEQDIQILSKKLPQDFDKIYSSPSSRCQRLASQIKGLELEYDQALMEMNFGDWEQQPWNDMDQQALGIWMADFVDSKAPNGESLAILFKRVQEFMDLLRKQDFKKAAIVTHAGVIRCIWAYLLDIPLQNIFKIPVDYGDGLVFSLNADKAFDQLKKTNI
ncbi:alpha-ribazole phosphatase [Pedobacter sp. N36a]|uniref:alpha-ribazole phosphatase n=1 Tax=Pedobacter sp. N36a TaxID=2767996 RepID=UPI0016574361|nr:alpha-ribazole phosphatase [Pedobacter sp. N36a]MBC8986978.1 alpha-ribazole phosphatase [Pedobacter sp. N36a]